MIYLVAGLFAMSIALAVVALGEFAPAQPRALTRTLADLEDADPGSGQPLRQRRLRVQRQRLAAVLEVLGDRLQKRRQDGGAVRQRLVHAGYMHADAPALYWGARLTLSVSLGLVALLLSPLLGAEMGMAGLASIWCGVVGWVAPAFYVGRRARARQKEIQLALSDTLDLLVICVEAGLGLNQALVRVAEEIGHVSPVTSEQLALVNLEIRAGTGREEALRNLGERTGVADVRSLAAMMIQTDRFGTSIAHALRVHGDTLRTKRRQRAEEAAAKTTVKLVFPLVLFIFPALFVVILGPAAIQIFRALSGFR